MALPTSRERTYAANSQVFSADLNALQDQFPSGGKRSSWTRSFWPKMLVDGDFVKGLTGTQPYIKSTALSTAPVFIEIPCDEGDRITAFTYEAFGDGSADAVTIVAYAVGMSGFASPTTLSTVTDNNRAASWGSVVMPSFTAQVVAAGGGLYLKSTADTNYRIGLCHATFDRL